MTRDFSPERREIAALRLSAQRIAGPLFEKPVEVVRHLLALQAQDYPGAKWSVGLRTRDSSDAAIEISLANREIVRSWPMRGTLHLVAAEDLGWMLELTGQRTLSGIRGRLRQLDISDDDLEESRRTALSLLADGPVPRATLVAGLEAAGQSTAAQRGANIILSLALMRVIVFGPVDGKQQTFASWEDWMPPTRVISRDDALAEFALRYLVSHGPATARDFAWWSSLTLTDARRGIAAVSDQLETLGDLYVAPAQTPATSGVWALPGFDEYLLGYQDRSAALHLEHFPRIVPGNNGMFMPTIVVDGEVVGTWRRSVGAREVTVEPEAFVPLSVAHRAGFAAASERYASFVDKNLKMVD